MSLSKLNQPEKKGFLDLPNEILEKIYNNCPDEKIKTTMAVLCSRTADLFTPNRLRKAKKLNVKLHTLGSIKHFARVLKDSPNLDSVREIHLDLGNYFCERIQALTEITRNLPPKVHTLTTSCWTTIDIMTWTREDFNDLRMKFDMELGQDSSLDVKYRLCIHLPKNVTEEPEMPENLIIDNIRFGTILPPTDMLKTAILANTLLEINV